jgi:protein PET100, fungi type
MYITFPIGIMWYFGTNLDNRFAVPEFWPKQEQTNKIPYEREEIEAELARMRARRLERRAIRLETEAKMKELDGARAYLHNERPQDGELSDPAGASSSGGILSYLGFGKRQS